MVQLLLSLFRITARQRGCVVKKMLAIILPRILFRRLLHVCVFHHLLCHHGTHREEEKKQAKKEARGGGVLSFDFEGEEGEEEEEGGGKKEKKQSDKESKGFVQWRDQLLHLPFLFSLPCYRLHSLPTLPFFSSALFSSPTPLLPPPLFPLPLPPPLFSPSLFLFPSLTSCIQEEEDDQEPHCGHLIPSGQG